jgi:hypothetical protein
MTSRAREPNRPRYGDQPQPPFASVTAAKRAPKCCTAIIGKITTPEGPDNTCGSHALAVIMPIIFSSSASTVLDILQRIIGMQKWGLRSLPAPTARSCDIRLLGVRIHGVAQFVAAGLRHPVARPRHRIPEPRHRSVDGRRNRGHDWLSAWQATTVGTDATAAFNTQRNLVTAIRLLRSVPSTF